MKSTHTAALLITHVAGMIDLVALPVWVGALVQYYALDFERAGLTVTTFLLGVVAASLSLAPLFNRLPGRLVAIGGYGTAAAAFFAAAQGAGSANLIVLHVIAGAGVGCGLSMTHGAIGRSSNPHRLFAVAGTALGVFSVAFYGSVPALIAARGGQVLFTFIGAVMSIAALASVMFPGKPDAAGPVPAATASASSAPITRAAWYALAGLVCLTLNQATVFSFTERIGVARGFGQDRVNLVLAIVGIVSLFPAALAGLLQRRLAPLTVAIAAPIAQSVLAIVITTSTVYPPFAAAASVFASVMIFAHTFLFGLIARLDPTGRATASMPAVLMIGSALGPALAGTVSQRLGFGGLGASAVCVAVVGITCFVRAGRAVRPSPGAAATTPAAPTTSAG
jgi:predicted MFS family arabinose efflux permease